MKKILNYILIGALLSFVYNCEEDVTGGSTNFVSFERGPIAFKVDGDATTTKNVKVYAGNVTGSDRTYTIVVNESSTLDASYYSLPSTVTIPANTNEGTITLSVTDDDNLGVAAETLVLDFMDESGVNFGNALTLNIAELCLDTEVTLKLTFDDFAEEAYFDIFDLSGDPVVIFSGGQGGVYNDLDGSDLVLEYCLASGNYGIVVYDNYGDGGTQYEVSTSANGVIIASGEVPDAGGGYPLITNASSTFTID